MNGLSNSTNKKSVLKCILIFLIIVLQSDEPLVTRTCYPCMRHIEGDRVRPRDCVLLKSGQRKVDLPFVAKVAALWENPEDGEFFHIIRTHTLL